MKILKFFVVRSNEFDDDTLIVCEDGGVATIRLTVSGLYLAEYYQDRIERPFAAMDNVFEELAEGKMYTREYPDAEQITVEMLQDAAAWLWTDKKDVEFKFEVTEGSFSDEDICDQIKRHLEDGDRMNKRELEIIAESMNV